MFRDLCVRPTETPYDLDRAFALVSDDARHFQDRLAAMHTELAAAHSDADTPRRCTNADACVVHRSAFQSSLLCIGGMDRWHAP
jgi:hypothetical protein